MVGSSRLALDRVVNDVFVTIDMIGTCCVMLIFTLIGPTENALATLSGRRPPRAPPGLSLRLLRSRRAHPRADGGLLVHVVQLWRPRSSVGLQHPDEPLRAVV